MICKYCNIENDDDAVFCKNCGKKLIEENLCSKCGCKNDDDAKFCKQCGNKLGHEIKELTQEKSINKPEVLKWCKFIMQIVSVCFCTLILLLSFGACFSPYLFSNVSDTGNFEQMGLFYFIRYLQEYQLPERLYGSEFHYLTNALPNIIGLIGCSLALGGCAVCLIYSMVGGIRVACKGKIPNLMVPAIGSTCSLLLGYMIISLLFITFSSSVYISLDAMLQGGGLVLSSIGLGLAWYILSLIGSAVVALMENFELRKLRNFIFRLGEFILLLIVIFNVSSGLLKIVQPIAKGSLEVGFSGVSFLSMFSDTIYNRTQMNEYFTFEGDLAVSYYFVCIYCVLVFVSVIVLFVFFISRLKQREAKSSITTGIVYFTTSLILLIISCITVQLLKVPNGGAELIAEDLLGLGLIAAYLEESFSVGLSANLIVTMVFATGLFALEIVWNRLEAFTKSKTMNVINS